MVKQRSVRGSDGAWRLLENSGREAGSIMQRELAECGADTLPLIVKYSAEKNGHRPCMGTRTLINRVKENVNGVEQEKLELGDYQWESYTEIYKKIQKVTASLLGLGIKPKTRIAIFAETRADWFTMAVGCLQAGITLVTLYTNLNDSSLIHGISETHVETVISSYDLLPRLCRLLPEISKVKRIIVLEDQLEGMGNPTELSSSVSFISFSALLLQADLSILEQHKGPDVDDIAIIMYTSGSTGNPKGVLLSHRNIFWPICSYAYKVDVGPGDTYLAFLPLPHVMELSTETALMALGVSIAYSSPLTLTSASPKIMKGTEGDAKMAQPTYINVVPLILDRVIKGVFANVEKQGRVKAKIFHSALRYKQNYNSGLTASLMDVVVFNKVKAELGGKIRMLISGGAPLSSRSCSIFQAMFGCEVLSGYGSTETTACTSCMEPGDTFSCSAGSPNRFVSILLEDWIEGGYRTIDKPRPRGEVLVGGDIVGMGYLNLPTETEESFVERNDVRYFKTGDIGEMDERGVLYLIDRKKDLVKLQQGEYVALGSVESVLKTHPLIDNICVFADSNFSFVVAVICPFIDLIRVIAKSLEKSDNSSAENLYCDPQIIKAVSQKVIDYAMKQNLVKADIPRKIHLTTDVWTPDNGFVTSAFKLRRKPLSKKYEGQVASMYVSP